MISHCKTWITHITCAQLTCYAHHRHPSTSLHHASLSTLAFIIAQQNDKSNANAPLIDRRNDSSNKAHLVALVSSDHYDYYNLLNYELKVKTNRIFCSKKHEHSISQCNINDSREIKGVSLN